jgi:hypothetical protein
VKTRLVPCLRFFFQSGIMGCTSEVGATGYKKERGALRKSTRNKILVD